MVEFFYVSSKNDLASLIVITPFRSEMLCLLQECTQGVSPHVRAVQEGQDGRSQLAPGSGRDAKQVRLVACSAA